LCLSVHIARQVQIDMMRAFLDHSRTILRGNAFAEDLCDILYSLGTSQDLSLATQTVEMKLSEAILSKKQKA
jgi:hypothetical protein